MPINCILGTNVSLYHRPSRILSRPICHLSKLFLIHSSIFVCVSYIILVYFLALMLYQHLCFTVLRLVEPNRGLGHVRADRTQTVFRAEKRGWWLSTRQKMKKKVSNDVEINVNSFFPATTLAKKYLSWDRFSSFFLGPFYWSQQNLHVGTEGLMLSLSIYNFHE